MRLFVNLLKMPFTTQPLNKFWNYAYVRPSRMTSLGWDPGSEWESPTSLSFKKETITARRYRNNLMFSPDDLIPPGELITVLEGQWNDLVRALHDENVRVDSGTEVGFRFVSLIENVVAELEVKTWPSVPGVTAPKLKEL